MRFKKTAILLILLLVGSLFAAYQYQQSVAANQETQTSTEEKTAEVIEEERKTGILPGEYASDFTLENLSGKNVSLSDFQGKYVLLNFWAIWCPPCREEMPDFNRFYLENQDEFTVVGVEIGSRKADVEDYIQENSYSYPILLDPKKEIGTMYRVTAIPTTYILNKEGKILHFFRGMLTYEALNAIKTALNN